MSSSEASEAVACRARREEEPRGVAMLIVCVQRMKVRMEGAAQFLDEHLIDNPGRIWGKFAEEMGPEQTSTPRLVRGDG